MRQSNFFILSLIILGLNSPGIAIDIFLHPPISKLQELWNVVVSTFDVSMNKFVLTGSIVEGYVARELVSLIFMYLDNTQIVQNRP
jgi:hypothetical protein